jgi:hypothetical protein
MDYTWQHRKLPSGVTHWIGPSGASYQPHKNGYALITSAADRAALLFSEEGIAREIAAAAGTAI